MKQSLQDRAASWAWRKFPTFDDAEDREDRVSVSFARVFARYAAKKGWLAGYKAGRAAVSSDAAP